MRNIVEFGQCTLLIVTASIKKYPLSFVYDIEKESSAVIEQRNIEEQQSCLYRENLEEHILSGDGSVPNSRFPIFIYRNSEMKRLSSQAVKDCLLQNGWIPDWFSIDGMYPRHHFHSDAHEFIAVLEGEFTCRLGGKHGINAHLREGDAIVIPAGVAHCGDRKSEKLAILGAFPAGFGIHDFRLGYPSEYSRLAVQAQKVPVPPNDPLYGPKGPLVQRWTKYS